MRRSSVDLTIDEKAEGVPPFCKEKSCANQGDHEAARPAGTTEFRCNSSLQRHFIARAERKRPTSDLLGWSQTCSKLGVWEGASLNWMSDMNSSLFSVPPI